MSSTLSHSLMTMTSASSSYDTTTTIGAMRDQEAKRYLCTNYFIDNNNKKIMIVNTDCRERMVDWCYSIADFCTFERETVEVAVSCFDLYMSSTASEEALKDCKVFQLTMMTALYIAVKMHEPHAMDPEFVSTLSQGAYTAEQVECMELEMLDAIQFRVNPPTSLSFVREYLHHEEDEHQYYYNHSHFQRSNSSSNSISISWRKIKQKVYKLATIQTEAAVRDHRFIAVKKSIIARAALTNALLLVAINDDEFDNIINIDSTDIIMKNHAAAVAAAADRRRNNAATGGSENEHVLLDYVVHCLFVAIVHKIKEMSSEYEITATTTNTGTTTTTTTATQKLEDQGEGVSSSFQTSPRCLAEAI